MHIYIYIDIFIHTHIYNQTRLSEQQKQNEHFSILVMRLEWSRKVSWAGLMVEVGSEPFLKNEHDVD